MNRKNTVSVEFCRWTVRIQGIDAVEARVERSSVDRGDIHCKASPKEEGDEK